jgi:NTE family protein
MDLIAPYIGDDIENLPTAFAAVATDLESGAEVILDRGPVYDAVRASIAIPGVFRPHRIDGRFLVDGGLSNPIPVSVARALGADFVLAVSVLRIPGHGEDGAATALAGDVDVAEAAGQDGTLADAATADHLGVLDVLSKGSAVVQSHIAAARLRVDPPDQALFLEMENIGLFQLRRSAEAIESGRQAALAAMPQILAAIEEARRAREHPIRHWISSALARPRSI